VVVVSNVLWKKYMLLSITTKMFQQSYSEQMLPPLSSYIIVFEVNVHSFNGCWLPITRPYIMHCKLVNFNVKYILKNTAS